MQMSLWVTAVMIWWLLSVIEHRLTRCSEKHHESLVHTNTPVWREASCWQGWQGCGDFSVAPGQSWWHHRRSAGTRSRVVSLLERLWCCRRDPRRKQRDASEQSASHALWQSFLPCSTTKSVMIENYLQGWFAVQHLWFKRCKQSQNEDEIKMHWEAEKNRNYWWFRLLAFIQVLLMYLSEQKTSRLNAAVGKE